MNTKLVKLIGLGASVAGVAISLLSDWVDEQKMKESVREEVDKALTEREAVIVECEESDM